MQKELEQIIKDYNLEGTRIQVGRQRIYPQREGLNATPDQLDSLKSLLAGNSVKGTLQITAGETVIAANRGGAIEKPFDAALLPNPPKQQATPMESPTVNTMPQTIDPVKAFLDDVQRGTVTPPNLAEKQFDYPRAAQEIDPAKDFRDTVQRGAATLQTQAISAKETLERAQKNLTTFAKHIKHRGLKAWAKDQLPLLQNRAKELMQTQATKLGEYVREQAPVARDAAIAGAKQVSQTVVQYAKDQAPIVAAQANAIGQQVAAKFTELTQRVDPAQIERLGTIILSQDDQFAGNVFNFKKGETGIDISLKNGTTVFRDGKLNPTLDTSYAIRLSQMAEQLEAVKPVQTTSTAQVEDKKKAVAR